MKKESRSLAIKICIIGVLLAAAWLLSNYIFKLLDTGEKNKADLQKVLQAANVGDYVTFGTYEQDNVEADGREPIEWRVLDQQDDRILVVSRYALDWMKYNTFEASVTWETCTLRAWLNGDFLEAAFEPYERERVLSVEVSADPNPNHATSPGNATTDRVFLLSVPETERYFDSVSDRACAGTAYCYARGAFRAGNGNCWWWLRTPGVDGYRAAYIVDSGVANSAGHVHDYLYAVRPAMWLSTKE